MEFQNVSVNLLTGIDESVDEIVSEGNQLLKNVDMSKDGTPQKRKGQQKLGNEIYELTATTKTLAGEMTEANDAVKFKEFAAVSNKHGSRSYSQALSGYQDQELGMPLYSVQKARTEDIGSGTISSSFSSFNVAENSKLSVLTINGALTVFDKATNSKIQTGDLNGIFSHCFNVLDDVIYFVFHGISSGAFLAKFNDDGLIETIGDIDPTYVADDNEQSVIDLCNDGEFLYAAYYLPTGDVNFIRVVKTSILGVVSASYNYLPTNAPTVGTFDTYRNTPLQICANSSFVYLCCSYHRLSSGSSNYFQFAILTKTLALSSEVNTIIGDYVFPYSIFLNCNENFVYFLASDFSRTLTLFDAPNPTFEETTHFQSRNAADLSVYGSSLSNRLKIRSKPLILRDNSVLAACSWRTDIDETYANPALNPDIYENGVVQFSLRLLGVSTVNVSMRVIAHIGESREEGLIIPSQFFLDQTFFYNDGVYRKGFILSENRENYGSFYEGQEQSLVPSARPCVFDGRSIRPMNVLARPRFLSVAVAAVASSVPAGTYDYIAIYQFRDSNGVIYRGRVSEPVQVVVGASSTLTFTMTAFGPIDVSNVEGVLYRKLNTETVYREVARGVNTFFDNVEDSSENPTLYTTGGILEAESVPAMKDIVIHNNRAFGVTLDDQVFYSQQGFRGEAFKFSRFQFLNIDESQNRSFGELVAIASLDNKLILFKNDSIYAVFGNGPDGTGANNDFSLPESVSTDVGCINPRSVVCSNIGVFFQGLKGIYLLTRNLTVEHIGLPAQSYADLKISSATMLEKHRRILFTSYDGEAIIYNYERSAWTVYDNFQSVNAFVLNGKTFSFKASAEVWIESDTISDGTDFIAQNLTTGWLKPNVQGYIRVQRMLIVGKYKGPHVLKARVYYDYEEYAWDEYVLTPETAAEYNKTAKPALADYQNGVNNGVYQWEIHLKRQKCQALKVELIDEQQGATPTEGCQLANITFKMGLKSPTAKISDNKVR